MRKEYGKVLRKLFDQKIKGNFSDFKPRKISSIYFTPGDRAFEKKCSSGTSLWINLSINAKFESFNVELGWSTLGRWPELNMRPSPIRPENGLEFSQEEYITRLPFLWGTDDSWFEVEAFGESLDVKDMMESMKPIEESTAKAKVEPVVNSCFEKLISYAIPYFESYAERNT